MAYASRLLSRSARQMCSGQSILRWEYAIPARSFAKEAGNAPPPLKSLKLMGDEMLKEIFLDVTKKYKIAIEILRSEKITIDPENPTAVAQYAKVMKTIREKAGLLSESEKIKYAIDTGTKDIPDARSYLLALRDINSKIGIIDEFGANAMMMEGLDKVEKQLKKPLLRNDVKGMALLRAEFDKVNQKLGICKEDLPKYEEELELDIATDQLEKLKKDAIEAMETAKKRPEFINEEIPDVKTLDIRNFL